MYCKKCGKEIIPLIDEKVNPEIETGEHRSCSIQLRYCTYCGEKESTSTHFGSKGYVFCQPHLKDCAKLFFEELNKNKFKPYIDDLPKFNENLQRVFLNLIDSEIDTEAFIYDVNCHDGYIVIYEKN